MGTADKTISVFSTRSTGTYNTVIGIQYNDAPDITSFKAWLVANTPTLVYPRATKVRANLTFTLNNASTAPALPMAWITDETGVSPDYPSAIVNSGGDVTAHGKNLFDGVFEIGGISSTTGENYVVTTTIRSVNFTPITPNTNYTISRLTPTSIRHRFYDANKNYIGNIITAKSDLTYVINVNASYVKFDIVTTDTEYQMQIELGSATPYEPYVEPQTYTMPTLRQGDVWYPMLGSVPRVRAVRVFDGASADGWVFGGVLAAQNCSYVYTNALDALVNQSRYICQCSHFKAYNALMTASVGYGALNDISVGGTGASRVRIKPPISVAPDLATWKAFLAAEYAAGHPVIVEYELATPTTETVTAVPNIPTTYKTTQIAVTGCDPNVLPTIEATLKVVDQ